MVATAEMTAALAALEQEPLSGTDKGIPASYRGTLADIGREQWRVLGGELPLPLLVLHEDSLTHNLTLMQRYSDAHGAWLAPHGKTTMAPQLFARQLEAGAWAITVASVEQLQVCRAFHFPRILVANEVVAEYDIRYIAEELRRDPGLEIYVLVDSPVGVDRLARGLADVNPGRRLPVLIELGMRGGRTGVRNLDEIESLAAAVRRAPDLRLAGVEGYEGIAAGADLDKRISAADRFLQDVGAATRRLLPLHTGRQPFLVSAGGSVFFDRVVEILGRRALPEAQLVLRSGGYLTHDSGMYDGESPFGSRSPRRIPGFTLEPALEIWSSVLSCPEEGLCILGMGRRDMPTDAGMPIPKLLSREGASPTVLDEEFAIVASNDQHAYLRMPPSADLRVGDRIGSGISHPCSAFDRWRTLLVVDRERRVTGALRTFF
jgi:D-serine dehydratase